MSTLEFSAPRFLTMLPGAEHSFIGQSFVDRLDPVYWLGEVNFGDLDRHPSASGCRARVPI